MAWRRRAGAIHNWAPRQDAEHYNYFRDYDAAIGRYVQSDPIGLKGGLNTYGYVESAPLNYSDRRGLFTSSVHNEITSDALSRVGLSSCPRLPADVAMVDWSSHSQDPANAHWHAMRDGTDPGSTAQGAQRAYLDYVDQSWKLCTCLGLARALHAVQDSFAEGHAGFQPWAGGGFLGLPSPSHAYHDGYPSKGERGVATAASAELIRKYKAQCKGSSCLVH